MITAEMKTQLEIERLQKQVADLTALVEQLTDSLKTARELLDQYRTLQ